MTSQVIQSHNITAVRRYFDALAEGDIGRVLCSLDDHVVLKIPATMNEAL